jgi:hypothetical protein
MISIMAFSLLFLASATMAVRPVPSHGDPDAREATPHSPSEPSILVVEIAGRPVVEDSVSLPRVDERSGEDVILAAWNLPRDAQVYVLVEDGVGGVRAFGPARAEGRWKYRAIGVVMGFSLVRGRRVRLRAVVSPSPPIAGKLADKTVVTVSPPVELRVATRALTPVGQCEIQIQVANDDTLDQQTAVLPGHVSLAGGYHCHGAPAVEHPFIYVATRCGAVNGVGLSGPGDAGEGTWRLADLDLDRETTREGYQCLLQAFIAGQPALAGPHGKRLRHEQILGSSAPLPVIVEAAPTHAQRKQSQLAISDIELDDAQVLHPGQRHVFQIPSFTNIVELKGRIDPLHSGHAVYVLVAAQGTGSWYALGPAIVTGIRWTLPVDAPPWLVEPAGRRMQLVAVELPYDQSTSGAALGYSEWGSRVVGSSDFVGLDLETSAVRTPPPSLALLRVNGQEFEPGTPVLVTDQSTFDGEVTRVPKDRRFFATVAVSRSNDGDWTIGASALVREGVWHLQVPPTMDSGAPTEPVRVLFLLTGAPIANERATQAQLMSMAFVSMGPMSAISASAITTGWSHLGGPRMVLLMVLTFALLVYAIYRFRRHPWAIPNASARNQPQSAAVGDWTSRAMASQLYRAQQAIARKLPWLANPTHSHWSLIGIGLGVALALAIANYAPVYTEVLHKALSLSRGSSSGIAWMLIIFNATGGIIIHHFTRTRGAAKYFFYLLLGGALLLSWVFSAMMYMESVKSEGAETAATALGAAVFVANLVETVAAYVALRLGGALAAWLLVSLVSVPLALAVGLLGQSPPPSSTTPSSSPATVLPHRDLVPSQVVAKGDFS